MRWLPIRVSPAAKMAVLQQIHLCIFGHRFGETNAEADEAHGFACAGKCFREQRMEIRQSRR